MKPWSLLLGLLLLGPVAAEPASLEVQIRTRPSGARVWLNQVEQELDTGQTTDKPVELKRDWFFDQNDNPVSRTLVFRLAGHRDARTKLSWGQLKPDQPILADDGNPIPLAPDNFLVQAQDHPMITVLTLGSLLVVLAGGVITYRRNLGAAYARKEAEEIAQRKILELQAQQQAQQEEAKRQAKLAQQQTLEIKEKQQILEQKTQAIQESGGKDPWIGVEITSRSMGSYAIMRKLGAGGMATVYEAILVSQKPGSPAKLALKIINRQGEDQARAVSEGQAGMQLVHPGILRCYDYVEFQGAICLFLELVEGGRDMTAIDKPIDPLSALKGLAAAAKALDEMHSRGYVHRDLKPSNIMLLADGQLKIADLGLIKNPLAQFQTGTETIMGTPHYMPPEQFQKFKAVSAAADQYALGCILYELIEGRLPFVGDLNQLIIGHLHGQPDPPTKLNPAAAQALLRMLAKEPEERYSSCFEALSVIRSLL